MFNFRRAEKTVIEYELENVNIKKNGSIGLKNKCFELGILAANEEVFQAAYIGNAQV